MPVRAAKFASFPRPTRLFRVLDEGPSCTGCYRGSIEGVAKISVSLDDALLAELKSAAGENVSAFISDAIRRQLRRRDLEAFLAELEKELGPPTEEELAEAAADFDLVEQANASGAKRRRRTA